MKIIWTAAMLFMCGILCGGHPEFKHDIKGELKPWTNENFPDLSVDKGEFSFAVIPDRTGSHREGVFKGAMAKINMLRPDFAVSVGDLVEGTPLKDTSSKEIDAQWKELRSMTETLKMPFFYCVGNHDINRNVRNSKHRFAVSKKAWEENFGKQTYYSFVYRNVLFIFLNSMEDGDKAHSPTPFSEAQQQWAVETLQKNPDVRWTFVFMHHPKFSHRSFLKIEKELLKRNYTVFAGDWHRYTKFSRYGRSYYVLSTCGGGTPREGKKIVPKHRGPEYGEMDHIAWVTMTKNGPVVANILLDGIVADDVVTQEKTLVPVRRKLDKIVK